MVEDLVYLLRSAVHQVQHALRCTRLDKQLHQPYRRERILLGGLEHESIAAGDGQGIHPQGDHGGKVERGDTRADADGLGIAVGIDAAGDVFDGLPHHVGGHIGGLLHDFDTPPDIALGVFESLAGILGEQFAKFIVMLLQQVAVTHHQAGPLGHRDLFPGAESVHRTGDGRIDLIAGGKGHFREQLLVGGVGHGQLLAAAALDEFAVDKQGYLTGHDDHLSITL